MNTDDSLKLIAAKLEILNSKLERLMLQQKLDRREIEDEIKELQVQQSEITAENNSLILIKELST